MEPRTDRRTCTCQDGARSSKRNASVPEPARTNELWAEFERIYEEHRTKGKDNPHTLREGIDARRKLSRQLPGSTTNERLTVLYPKSSDIMRAARFAKRDEIVNDTLYHWKAGSQEEAAYLVALLNAPALKNAFADAKRSGRHFDTDFLAKVPIPLFDAHNSDHVELAGLTVEAEELIEQWMDDRANTAKLKQVGLSKRIRTLLEEEGILSRIDTIARKVLPRQSSA